MDNRFELVFNERDDAAELKNLPIDDNMHGIIEEEEMSEEGSDEEPEVDIGVWTPTCVPSVTPVPIYKTLTHAWSFSYISTNQH